MVQANRYHGIPAVGFRDSEPALTLSAWFILDIYECTKCGYVELYTKSKTTEK
jgi:hypothetical protein